MAVSIDSSGVEGRVAARVDPVTRPAAAAAARVFLAGLGLGVFGLVSVAFVLVRLVESWHITPGASAHRVTIFGERLGYPAANLDAIVVLLLALLAVIAVARCAVQTLREGLAAARLRRGLDRSRRGELADALLIDAGRPLAFCAGLLRPRVYVSTGAVDALDARALSAVLDHERQHARRRDPLRAAAGRILAAALFFVPGIRELARRHEALAELSADEGAIHASPGNRSGLAHAMLAFTDASPDSGRAGFDPERIDSLLGHAPSWSFPALVCLGAASVIATLLAIAVVAGQAATGSASLAPPVLSGQPCIVALASIPAALAVTAAFWGRRARMSRRS